MFITRREIIDKINHFSERRDPFVFAVDFSAETGFVLSPGEARDNGIRYDLGIMNNILPAVVNKPLRFGYSPVDFQAYLAAFNKVLRHINRGDTYLLNLTFPTPLETDLPPGEIFSLGRAPFKMFVPGWFAVFSPELFVQIRDSKIISCPMKGTIEATVPDAEKQLLSNEKELFEHHTIVDLIRNDLSIVSTGVTVTRFRYIDRIRTNRGDLLQMSSEICGNLEPGYRKRMGNILFDLLPAGSVTGAPKEKTVRIIRETETYDRGFYTGIFGGSDGRTLTSAVSIRFIDISGGSMVFKSGGGITALSDAESEYREMIAKVYVPVV